ncbi:Uncharacterised protein [Vibrio cholerae]|nr:Uncharacterised protein [Vibrio cholerae]
MPEWSGSKVFLIRKSILLCLNPAAALGWIASIPRLAN